MMYTWLFHAALLPDPPGLNNRPTKTRSGHLHARQTGVLLRGKTLVTTRAFSILDVLLILGTNKREYKRAISISCSLILCLTRRHPTVHLEHGDLTTSWAGHRAYHGALRCGAWSNRIDPENSMNWATKLILEPI